MRPRVSLVLPVHNQADHIEEVVRAHLASFERLSFGYEIILVPNGSHDATGAVCDLLAAEFPAVTCLKLDGRGWGLAVRKGISAATGELICYANSARTQPDDVRRMVEVAALNPDAVVKAVRLVRHSVLRYLGAKIYNLQCAGLFDLKVNDVNGTPKVFPRNAGCLKNLTRDDDLLDLELMRRCRREGILVIEVPVFTDSRHGGRSTTGWKTAFTLYVGAMRLWYETKTKGLS